MSIRCVLIVLSCALLHSCIWGETRISGDFSAFTFNSSGNPFVVDSDAAVPDKKTVVIDEGCVVLFKEFTGLAVYGSLIVKGTQEKPVVFSSINDSTYNHKATQAANPFDWNGLFIDKNADSVSLNNFKLMFSVYGIKAQKETIILTNGIFNANGQFNFTMNDKIQYVQNKMPFSYCFQKNGPIANPASFNTKKDARKKALLTLSSVPQDAEIYVNKKPGPRVEPEAHTPATIKIANCASVNVTLFKKGYTDTSFSLDLLPDQTVAASVSLRDLAQDLFPGQKSMLKQRLKVRIGRCCLISSPVFLIGAGSLFFFAQRDYATAKDANDYVNSMIAKTPEYSLKQQEITDYNRKGDTKTNFGFFLLGLGCIAAGAGIALYF